MGFTIIKNNGCVSGSPTVTVYDANGIIKRISACGGGPTPPTPVAWGDITGIVTNQTDLINYLDLNFYPLSSNPAGYLTDAPSDGSTYGRNNGAWTVVSGSGTLVALPFTTDHLTVTSNPYVVGDVVYYIGNVYRCIANNDSILPTNALYWTNLGAGFPLVQQPSDWNSTSGNNQILNKPTIPAYTVDNGLTENPTGNFQLGGPLIQDTNIDGAGSGTWMLDFTNLHSSTNSARYLYQFETSDGGNTAILALNSGDGKSTFSQVEAVSGSESAIQLLGTQLRVQTPAYATATNGDVLTLLDNTTGEAEWQTPTTGGGSGGGRSYYLNGSVVQGTFAGITDMRQMSPVPIIGVGTDFTINTDGFIKSFITDAGDPNKAVIPAGNWNFELWFSVNNLGGSPNFYVELYKYDTVALTFTLISSSSASPAPITNGTTISLYLTALSVPQTTLALTDRLAVRVWVNHGGGGRVVTLHTQGPHLSQIITDFPSGIVSLNGLTAFAQSLAVGTAGTDFGISSSVATHTFNLPTASAANRGALSSADWSTFNDKAPIASPAFTGNPTAPTPASGDNDTSIATTAFVTSAVQQSLSFIGYFGAGTDGNVTISGAVTLTSDMFYNDLTIAAGGSLYLAGYRIFVKGNLDLTNAGASGIHNNGYAGGNNVSSVSGALNAAGTVGRGGFGSTVYGWAIGGVGAGKQKGGFGANGGSAGGNGANAAAVTILGATEGIIGGNGGASGAGGNSASGATGGLGITGQGTGITIAGYTTYTPQTFITNPAGNVTLFNKVRQDTSNTGIVSYTPTTYIYYGAGHGAGGGGGASNAAGSIAGMGGGAGGGGGGTASIFARNIIIGPTTNAQAISATGGTGGTGGSQATFNAAGGGGAGGGGGGFVYLVVGSISGTTGVIFISANGGTGGNGGSGRGAGNFGGTGGSGGYGGKITVVNLSTNSITVTDSTATAASAAATPIGTAGTAGTAGTTCTYSS